MSYIIGLGGGRYSDGEMRNVAEYIVSLAKKDNPALLFVPTAGFDDINGDEDILDTYKDLGCSVDILFLTDESLTPADIENKIMGSDIIYVGGGHLKFLMDTWKKTGADRIFRKAHEAGIILSGYSSGMMCWFKEGYDDCAEDRSFMFVDCLGLLPFSSCPHFDGGNWYTFEDAVKGRGMPAIAADNGAAIFFDGEKCFTMQGNDGGEVYYISNGEKLLLERGKEIYLEEMKNKG